MLLKADLEYGLLFFVTKTSTMRWRDSGHSTRRVIGALWSVFFFAKAFGVNESAFYTLLKNCSWVTISILIVLSYA